MSAVQRNDNPSNLLRKMYLSASSLCPDIITLKKLGKPDMANLGHGNDTNYEFYLKRLHKLRKRLVRDQSRVQFSEKSNSYADLSTGHIS